MTDMTLRVMHFIYTKHKEEKELVSWNTYTQVSLCRTLISQRRRVTVVILKMEGPGY